MKIGLFFGSFNPIHIGHLIIANTIYDRTDLNEVWFVVSPQNPFKKRKSLIHEHDRLRMVELAIEDNYHFRASDVEFHMPRPSYTIDTLTYLSEQHPQHQFCLFLGSDNLSQFKKWKNYEQILEHYEIYVYPRPGEKQEFDHPAVHWVNAPLLDVSATFIRESVQKGYSVKYLLPQKVEEYIRDKKLYL
ncbi:nicotinate (nicotinamide) nucleotide adenylyltransferase [Algoriphagus sp. CAU 1675]|uniref:nicotinate (nicotinamide) nucleotide adenylyltransferase n=1 Tax=Algoriphagus sp. CAU 1675 TaxID=3032597 RepID=UPI0023DBFEAA|nr:nicotinate (nicotinamide) nucleotide adenylyltransferase [Algoriphagus sp. CAU 1675]MDF2156774.1 nicotinate (nicotinamide) nucleotide adenylyltransferase [Algoriphagus sp. CAU 1675]